MSSPQHESMTSPQASMDGFGATSIPTPRSVTDSDARPTAMSSSGDSSLQNGSTTDIKS